MICPILKEECQKEKCAWWVRLMNKNPATQEMNEISSCAIPLIVDIGIDTGKGISRVQAAVESDRNVTQSSRNILLNILKNGKMIGG